MEHLTKSRIAEYEQCEKRFWLSLHRPELAAVAGGSLFAGGNQVGGLARALLPNGVAATEIDAVAAVEQTAELVQAHPDRPIFEAAFRHERVLVRADVLLPEEGGWRMIEVKSSGSVKAYQLADLATQVWVAQGAGLPLAGAVIRHVDTSFTYPGGGEYAGLFKDAEVHGQLGPLVSGRADLVREAWGLALAGEPAKEPGQHCSDPFECPFTAYCLQNAPAQPDYPVTLLPGVAGKKIAAELSAAGYNDLRDVPIGAIEPPAQIRIHEATRSGIPYHDRAAFAAAVGAWSFPRYYLDFETIAHVVPPWAGTRPYQAVPFQFSCHVEEADGALTHTGFLDLSGDDPSRACAEALIDCIGDEGAIITYNVAFERGCITGLAARFPDLSDALMARAERLVDALPLVRAHYYHRDMRGSYSIKAVLPVVAPHLSYSDLEGVRDGQGAQIAYLEATAPETAPQRRDQLQAQLSSYCGLDTLAMVELVRALSS